MAEKIILTTLSVLDERKSDKVNYYSWGEGINKTYCTGISAQEPGTKHFLSTQKIDRIIAVGSEATEGFTYDFYKERIGAFLQGKESDYDLPDTGLTAGEKQLAENAVKAGIKKYNGKGNPAWADIISGDTGIWDAIKAYIRSTAADSNTIQAIEDYAISYAFSDLNLKKSRRMQSISGKKAPIQFVPLTKGNAGGIDNISGILQAIGSRDVELYIDVQGGSRTDSFVLNAVLTMLSTRTDQHICLREIVAVNYRQGNFCNRLIDETKRYKLSELASGMNAFLEYGKAGIIQKYLTSVGEDDQRIQKLVSGMSKVEESLGLCNAEDFASGIEKIKAAFDKSEENESSYIKEILSLLSERIRTDFGKLLEGDTPDTIAMIEWTLKKGMVQQALTFTEAKMPGEMVRGGLVFYCDSPENRKGCLEQFKDYYEYCKSDRWKLNDVSYGYVSLITEKTISFFEKGSPATTHNYQRDEDNKQIVIELPLKTLSGNYGRVAELLRMYIDIHNLRNSINHGKWCADNQSFISEHFKNSKPKTEKWIKDFLTAYKACIKTVNPQKAKAIIEISNEEIRT